MFVCAGYAPSSGYAMCVRLTLSLGCNWVFWCAQNLFELSFITMLVRSAVSVGFYTSNGPPDSTRFDSATLPWAHELLCLRPTSRVVTYVTEVIGLAGQGRCYSSRLTRAHCVRLCPGCPAAPVTSASIVSRVHTPTVYVQGNAWVHDNRGDRSAWACWA